MFSWHIIWGPYPLLKSEWLLRKTAFLILPKLINNISNLEKLLKTFHSRKRKQSKDTTCDGALSKRVTPFSGLRHIFSHHPSGCLPPPGMQGILVAFFSSSLSVRAPLRTHKNCIQPFSYNSPLASKKKTVEKSRCIFNAGHSAATSRIKAGSFLFADMQALAKSTLQPLQNTGRACRFVQPRYSSDLCMGSLVKISDSTEANHWGQDADLVPDILPFLWSWLGQVWLWDYPFNSWKRIKSSQEGKKVPLNHLTQVFNVYGHT